ncbi:MAG: HTH-type transcriptional regulator GntR [Candidatus Erwinia impunctatus]|nr:HTH-type transcriptional regulator GntR [Culicoides impunctatus]
MKSNRMTLQDIASLAGVNKMTVSRYLRDPGQVSEQSRATISRVLEDNHYIPNRAPEILLGARSRSLGVLIPSFRNQIFLDVLAGIESVASAQGYQTLIAHYEYDPQLEEEKIINLLSYNVDALLLTEKRHTKRTIHSLRAAAIPVAEMMDITEHYIDIQVGFDNEKAAIEMTRVLLESGKRHLVYMGAMDDPRDISRFRGVTMTLTEQGLTALHMAPKAITSVALGRQLFSDALRILPELDAVFCTNDDLAIGVLLECQDRNIAVPQQVAIAGFHGLEIGQANRQKMASVITPRYQIGQTATELILKKLEGKPIPNSVEIDYQIYYGDTV